MKKLSFSFVAAPLALGLLSFAAPFAHAQDKPAAAQTGTKTIVELAIATPELSTLVTAVKAAGLVDTLSGPGPFTVFAPTNAAFAKIPKARLAALLADKAALTKVLTYHVLPAKIEAATVVGMKAPAKHKTVEGTSVLVSPKPPMVNKSKIIKTDIEASNGVIHLIDTVLMPSDMGKMGKMKPAPKKM